MAVTPRSGMMIGLDHQQSSLTNGNHLWLPSLNKLSKHNRRGDPGIDGFPFARSDVRGRTCIMPIPGLALLTIQPA
jgi:hypothetical protein